MTDRDRDRENARLLGEDAYHYHKDVFLGLLALVVGGLLLVGLGVLAWACAGDYPRATLAGSVVLAALFLGWLLRRAVRR